MGSEMKTVDLVVQGYLDAVRFTDTGSLSEPHPGWPLDAGFIEESRDVCERVWFQYQEKLAGVGAHNLGWDLWFSRQSHSAGFRAKPEIYGQALADELARVAAVLGRTSSSFEVELPHIASLVQCLNAEIDTDAEGADRVTQAQTIGWLARRDDQNGQWSLNFPNGASIWVTDDELQDAAQYRLVPLGVDMQRLERLEWRVDGGFGEVEASVSFAPPHADDVRLYVVITASADAPDVPDSRAVRVNCVVRMGDGVEEFSETLVSLDEVHECDPTDLRRYVREIRSDLLYRAILALSQAQATEFQTSVSIPRG